MQHSIAIHVCWKTFPTKNLVEVEKSYNGKLSTSCTSTVLHSGTFLNNIDFLQRLSFLWVICLISTAIYFKQSKEKGCFISPNKGTNQKHQSFPMIYINARQRGVILQEQEMRDFCLVNQKFKDQNKIVSSPYNVIMLIISDMYMMIQFCCPKRRQKCFNYLSQ